MAEEGTRQEDRATATAQAHGADAQASEEGKRLNDTRLLAPISGSIGMRRVDPGQTVAAGTPVFSIVELNPVKVRVGVPEAEIGKVRQGAAAEVSVPSLDGRRFTGKVAIIGVAAEPASRTYTVKILVPNPGPVLLAGMVAEARIFGPAKIKSLTIPGEAVVPDPQGAPNVYVYFPDRKRVYGRRVEVGPPVGKEVEIRSGLHWRANRLCRRAAESPRGQPGGNRGRCADESGSRIIALSAGHDCPHDHVGRLRRLCAAADAAAGGSEDPRARRNRGCYSIRAPRPRRSRIRSRRKSSSASSKSRASGARRRTRQA